MATPPLKPGEIAEAVRTAIKRDGTFDAVRKRAEMDVSHADGFLDDVRIEGKDYCDKMFESLFGDSLDMAMSKTLKEFMMTKIKGYVSRKDAKLRVRRAIDQEITDEWMQRALQEKVEELVRAQLGLPPLPKPAAEETDVEAPSSKSDEVKQEEPEEDSDPVMYEDGGSSSSK